jgi:ATP-dependent DNA ligase
MPTREPAWTLPVVPPVEPMLAKAVPEIPGQSAVSGSLLYEPKWDGFRCIVFRDGDRVELGSRGGKPLTRYFPEVVDAVRAAFPARAVVDGEVVVAVGDRLDFDTLLQRIHPAESRIRRLAAETPAHFVGFDLLAAGDESLMAAPFAERHARLEEALTGRDGVSLTPATRDEAVARDWFDRFEGAGLDGVVAKPLAAAYTPGKRTMLKIKHARTADVVVGGFRWHKNGAGTAVGSLMLGLYDDAGSLRNIGVAASFPMAERRALVERLAPYRTELDAHPWAGLDQAARNRWNAAKDLSFVPLRPELVCEVAYDHMEGDRFRHTAQFQRWRPDRDPRSCGYAQLERPVRYDLADVLGT